MIFKERDYMIIIEIIIMVALAIIGVIIITYCFDILRERIRKNKQTADDSIFLLLNYITNKIKRENGVYNLKYKFDLDNGGMVYSFWFKIKGEESADYIIDLFEEHSYIRLIGGGYSCSSTKEEFTGVILFRGINNKNIIKGFEGEEYVK